MLSELSRPGEFDEDTAKIEKQQFSLQFVISQSSNLPIFQCGIV
jgi:hypothetical protein